MKTSKFFKGLFVTSLVVGVANQVDAQTATQGLSALNNQLSGVKEPVRQTVMLLGGIFAIGALGFLAYKFFFEQQTSKAAIMGVVGGMVVLGIAAVI